jgi:two-component system, LytTR family, sensor histidine kinase AlgZ
MLRFALGSAAVDGADRGPGAALLLRQRPLAGAGDGPCARAEADALQARIRPHFLFNSMNTIAGLVRRDPEVAERAVLDLSDLFRAALGAGEGDSSLADEVRTGRALPAIERCAWAPRLQVQWRRHEPLPWDLPLPRLVLQPLVENAVLHGVSRLRKGGTVEIGLRADGRWLHI